MNSLRSGSLAVALTLLVPAGAALGQDASSSPIAEPTLSPVAQAFADVFPGEIGGVSLDGLIEVGDLSEPDALDPAAMPLMAGLAEDLGIGLEDILMAGAATFSDFFAEEPDGVWIMAIQAPGMAPDVGVDLMVELWTMEAEDADIVIEQVQIAGRDVTRVAAAAGAAGGALNFYGSEGIAWMVAGPDALLEEALSKLP